eukprot:6492615-Amphidinium_carterae.3
MLAGQTYGHVASVESSVKPEHVANRDVLIEYACFDDSLLSAEHELRGGVAIRFGLPSVDLSSSHGEHLVTHTLQTAARHARSVVMWVSIPCSAWSSLQFLNQNKYGSAWLEQRRERALPLVKCAVRAVKQALELGIQVCWEWPSKAAGWNLEELQDILKCLPVKTRIDACSYGFRYQDKPCKKPWLIRSSLELPGLGRLCSCTETHIPCEGGSHVAKSSRYTPQMVRFAIRAIRKGLLKTSATACASDTEPE